MVIEVLSSLRDVLLVVLGGCLTAVFGYVQARHMLYSQARMKFCGAFLPELTKLLGQDVRADECATLQLLEASFTRHQSAYVELWASASWLRRRRLERRWKRYCYGDNPESLDQPFTYLASNVYEEPDMRRLAIKHIQHLIS